MIGGARVTWEPAWSGSEGKCGGCRAGSRAARISERNRFGPLDKTGPGLVSCHEWPPQGRPDGPYGAARQPAAQPAARRTREPSGPRAQRRTPGCHGRQKVPAVDPAGFVTIRYTRPVVIQPAPRPAAEPWWKARPEQTGPCNCPYPNLPGPERIWPNQPAPARKRQLIPHGAPDRALWSDGVSP